MPARLRHPGRSHCYRTSKSLSAGLWVEQDRGSLSHTVSQASRTVSVSSPGCGNRGGSCRHLRPATRYRNFPGPDFVILPRDRAPGPVLTNSFLSQDYSRRQSQLRSSFTFNPFCLLALLRHHLKINFGL